MATKTSRGRPKGSGIDDDKIIAKINKLIAKDPDLKPTTAIKTVGITDASSIRRLRDKLKSDAPVKKAASKPAKAAKKPAAPRKAAAAKSASKKVKTRTAAKPKAATAKKASAPKKDAAPKKAAASKKPAAKKKAATKKTVSTRTTTTAAKKPVVKKTVATRTAATSMVQKTDVVKKAVPTKKIPGKSIPSPADILNGLGMSNTFGEMAKGMKMPTNMADLNIENIVTTTVEKQIQFYESALKLSPMANLLRQQALLTDMILTVMRKQKEFSKSMNIKG